MTTPTPGARAPVAVATVRMWTASGGVAARFTHVADVMTQSEEVTVTSDLNELRRIVDAWLVETAWRLRAG